MDKSFASLSSTTTATIMTQSEIMKIDDNNNDVIENDPEMVPGNSLIIESKSSKSSSSSSSSSPASLTSPKSASKSSESTLPPSSPSSTNGGFGFDSKKKSDLITMAIMLTALSVYFLSNVLTINSLISFLRAIPGSYEPEDLNKDMFQLIKSRGFNYESHHLQTKDGYILQMVRLINPFVTNQTEHRPILLLHGFQCTGTVWLINNDGHLDENGNYLEFDENNQIINGTNNVGNTLGFVLSSRGYDVWIGNLRGTYYSPNHTKYDSDSEEFWKFSMDEMIRYDLPDMIEYILKITGYDSLSFIGHSQGNTLMLALMAIEERYQTIVKPFIALSPCWYNVNMRSIFARFTFLKSYLNTHPQQFVLQNMTKLRTVLANLCSNVVIREICYRIYNLFVGYNPENVRVDRIPVYLFNVPSGSSSWNHAQHIQTILSEGPMEHYDFGTEELNQLNYGMNYPPIYNVSNIKVDNNLVFFYVDTDRINSLLANQLLKKDLSHLKLLGDYQIKQDNWDHMSFVWGKTTGKFINNRILNLLSMYD